MSKQKLNPCPICSSTKGKCIALTSNDPQYVNSNSRLIICYEKRSENDTPDGYQWVGLADESRGPGGGMFRYVGGHDPKDVTRLMSEKLIGVASGSRSFLNEDGSLKTSEHGGVSLRGKSEKYKESLRKGVFTLNQWRLYSLDEYIQHSWESRLFKQFAEEEAARRKVEQAKDLLSIGDRDRQYQRVIRNIPLNHDAVLRERGLNGAGLEMAREFGFRSWKANTVMVGLSPKLAGANHEGNRLRGINGLVIPARTPQGQITGFQVSPDSQWLKERLKYGWISSASDDNGAIPGNGPNLPNGELPHFSWIYPGLTPGDIREVWLVEGGLKSFLTASFLWQHGIVDVGVVGAPGNYFGTDTVKDYLAAFTNAQDIRFMVDAGMTENAQVAQSYYKAIRFIQAWGYTLSIGWWGQFKKKSSLDLDELIIPTGNTIKLGRLKPSQIILVDGQARRVQSVRQSNFDSFGATVEFEDGGSEVIRDDVQVVSQIEKIDWITPEQYYEFHSPKIKKLIEPFEICKAGVSTSEFPIPDPWQKRVPEFLSNDEVLPQQYHPDDRLEVWREFVTGGDDREGRKRYVLDSSNVGSGKTHTAGLLSANELGNDHITKVVYLTSDPQNPSAITFSKENGWATLRGRDYGRVLKTTKAPDGAESKQIRRAPKDYSPEKHGPLFLSANCDRAGLAELLAERNVPPNSANICNGCVFKTKCNLTSGSGFGYLGERKDAMMAEKIIAHPESIDLDEIDEDEVVALICEEASTFPWFKTYEVTSEDVNQTIVNLVTEGRHDPAVMALVDVITELKRMCHEGKGSDLYLRQGYGWDHSKVLEEAGRILREHGHGELPYISPQQLEQLSKQDLSVLADVDQWEGADADSRRALRNVRASQTSGSTLVDTMKERLGLRWLPDFYRALRGDKNVRVTCTSSSITIRIINERLRSILTHERVAVTIFLDGTESPEFFEKQLGKKIHHVRAELPEEQGSVDIIQVHGLGLLSTQRGEKQQNDVKAIEQHIRAMCDDPNVPVIDLKSFASEGDGIWHKDSRGSNLYANAQSLILVGVGIPNLGVMRDEFALLNGYHPSTEETLRAYPVLNNDQPAGGPWLIRVMKECADEKLARHIRQETLKQYHQAIGRLRAIRRPGESLTIYAITDYPLDLPVTVVDAKQVLTSRQTVNDRIQRVIEAREKRGWEVTTRAVAKQAKCSAGYVSKSEAWKAYRAKLSASSGVIPGVNIYNNTGNHDGTASNPHGERDRGPSKNETILAATKGADRDVNGRMNVWEMGSPHISNRGRRGRISSPPMDEIAINE
jgi:hypothetical protein